MYAQQLVLCQAAKSSVTATMTALHNKFTYSEYQVTATLVSNALALGYSHLNLQICFSKEFNP